MEKIKDFFRKCKFSEESVYIFAERRNRKKFKEAMNFHIMKNIALAGLLILVIQILLLGLMGLL
jgi:hypothetical protein